MGGRDDMLPSRLREVHIYPSRAKEGTGCGRWKTRLPEVFFSSETNPGAGPRLTNGERISMMMNVGKPFSTLARRALCFMLLSLLANTVTSARALIPVHDLSFGQADTAAFIDLFGDGRLDLLVAGPEGIALFATPENPLSDEDWHELLRLPPLPQPITAAVAADVTGDGVNELVLGTGQAGAVYVLRRTGTGWKVLAQTSYLWSPVHTLEAADLSGDGKADIVVLSADGRVNVFGWEHPTLQNIGQLPADSGGITHIGTVAKAGRTGQLVTAERNGRVAAWTWPLAAPSWETYVWGLPASLTVLREPSPPAGGDVAAAARDTVIVTTDERLLYNFRADGEGLASTGSPLHDIRLPFSLAESVKLPGDAGKYIFASGADGLGLWRVTGTGITFIDRGWAEKVLWAQAIPDTDTFIVRETDRPLTLWERKPTNYLRFSVNGINRNVTDPPLFKQSQVMLSARDWASALNMRTYWDAPEQQLTLVRGFEFAVTTMNEWHVLLPNGRRTVSMPAVNEGGRTYMPPELPAWFSFDYRWDPRTRNLQVYNRPRQGNPGQASNSTL